MISVIVPALNATSTIGRCLIGLKKQTLQPKEVIVVDDGSKDNLELEIKRLKLELKMNNLIMIKQNHKGVSAARNLGAKKATGKILAFIDSDCIPGKNWLKNINISFSDPDVGAVGGGYSYGADNSFWQRFSSEELFFRRQKREKRVQTLLSNNMACRRDYFWQAGGFPQEYVVCEDMFLSFQISRKHRVLWLKNNGVRHHFKRNLIDFLKHQYFFSKESTRFFLENPEILFGNNHQGKRLHLTIIFSLCSFISLFISLIFLAVNNLVMHKVMLTTVIILLLVHFVLYIEFIFYLKKKYLSYTNIIKSYFVSFVRDLIASIASLHGLALYIRKLSTYTIRQ